MKDRTWSYTALPGSPGLELHQRHDEKNFPINQNKSDWLVDFKMIFIPTRVYTFQTKIPNIILYPVHHYPKKQTTLLTAFK